VVAPDQPGLLHKIATAFAASGIDVVSATIVVHDGTADDRFEVVDSTGNKVDDATAEVLRRHLAGGVRTRRGFFGRQKFELVATP
jgi:UTP:GlnB (protein PII) uridylyltransferase